MIEVFADTFFWVALTNPDDFGYADAVEIDSKMRTARVVTTDEVLAKFMTFLDLYEARPDKGYSLTDCISMQMMRQRGITEALTNDRHFEQGGFRALFR